MAGPGAGKATRAMCSLSDCFDELLRACMPCDLYRTPRPPRADHLSSSPGTVRLTAPMTNTSLNSVPWRLPGLGLVLGIPLGLALVLALLFGLLVCLLQRRLERAPVDAEAGPQWELEPPLHQEPHASMTQNSNSGEKLAWQPSQECEGNPGAPEAASHSIPVPATELGAMVLVTTKTTSMEL